MYAEYRRQRPVFVYVYCVFAALTVIGAMLHAAHVVPLSRVAIMQDESFPLRQLLAVIIDPLFDTICALFLWKMLRSTWLLFALHAAVSICSSTYLTIMDPNPPITPHGRFIVLGFIIVAEVALVAYVHWLIAKWHNGQIKSETPLTPNLAPRT
jgi:hypothetical protein